MPTLDDLDPTFREKLFASKPSIVIVGTWFEQQGFEIEIPEIVCREKVEDRHRHKDKGDLFYWDKEGEKKRVEVKHRKTGFTSLEDYPWPDYIVDTCHKVHDETVAWFSVNRAMTHAIIIPMTTRAAWTQRIIRPNGRDEECYFCPKSEKVTLVSLPKVEPDTDPMAIFEHING